MAVGAIHAAEELGNGLSVFASRDVTLKCFPELKQTPDSFTFCGTDGIFSVYRQKLTDATASCSFVQTDFGCYKINDWENS